MTTSLFNIIPPNLFKPLAAPGAEIYAEALLRLFREAQRSYQPLSRETALYIVGDVLSDPAALSLTEDADDEPSSEQSDLPVDATQARAAAILRYLTRCGWFRSEMQSDFTQTYVLPDYTFRLLAVLTEITRNDPPSLRGLICAIHDMLIAAAQSGDAHIRLPEAHRQTMHLINGLKELQHNIGAHIEQLVQQSEARAVLEQLFFNYRDEIVDRVYHQLRTTDHISRFRPGVIQALKQIEAEGHIDTIAQRLFQSQDAPTIEAAAIRARDQLRDIQEQFDSLDRFLQAIDTRHSQFVDSAVRNVELRLTASSTTSGQLHTILERLLTDPDLSGRELPGEFGNLIDLFKLELVDAESLMPPSQAAVPFEPQPVVLPVLSEAEIAAAQTATLRQLNRAISRERVRRFAFDLLGDRESLRGAEITLDDPGDLPLLIYLRVYGDGSLGYRVEEAPDAGWIVYQQVGFRDFLLLRER
ncbi:MAG TPA: Wadjet anti-phage system protein JetA family protein [Herpetosiphonaceae bacterium]